MRCLFLATLLAAALLVPAARGQERSAAPLAPEARALVVESNASGPAETVFVPSGRLDPATGRRRAAYRIDAPTALRGSAETSARRYLASQASAYGLEPGLNDLERVRVVETPYSAHVRFRQMVGEVPVYGREITVSLDRRGRPTMAISSYARHVAEADIATRPRLSAAAAGARARELVDPAGETSEPTLVVYPAAVPALAWRVVVWPAAAPAEWEVLIDAQTDEPLQLINQSTASVHASGEPAEGAAARKDRAVAAPSASGSGLVFDPNPLRTAGVAYGGAYVDQNDADLPELASERKERVLRDLSERDGRYVLEGPYVRIVEEIGVGDLPYTPPSEADPDAFRYSRSDPSFEAVMAYYHIDASQRYVQSLDVGRPIAETPVRVNPRYTSYENSGFFYDRYAIGFGTGGVDDAEDGEVILHEYAHALLESSAPGLFSASDEGKALHEGWSDYWAASSVRGAIERSELPPSDWHHLFVWDGNNAAQSWCGRWINHPGHYPDAMDTPPPAGCSYGSTAYVHGLLWATTLMELYSEVGRTVSDRLNLASHAYLARPATLRDAAEAILQADLDLYDGAHAPAILAVFSSRGFLDAPSLAPHLTLLSRTRTEQLGGTLPVAIEAEGRPLPVDSVHVYYAADGGASGSIKMENLGGGLFRADVPLPAESGSVRLQFESVDRGGRRRIWPEDPADSPQLVAGPDHEPPAIEHVPMERVSLVRWPVPLTVAAWDDLGIDSIWVAYRLFDDAGALQREGQFGLAREGEGFFDLPREAVETGGRIEYRIHARDSSRSANETALPAAGYFSTEIMAEGVLLAYAFEGEDAAEGSATGSWAVGKPAYGLKIAHGGAAAWGTNPEGRYPDSAGVSTLTFGPMNLQGLGKASLQFWHWFDTEQSRTALPGMPADGVLYDGGNVKVSVDGGSTWSLMVPEGGYPRTIAASENPLGSEPGFGGYSYGWQRVRLPLPLAPNVLLRFSFGTDASTVESRARYHAGWFIDDVSVATSWPPDEQAPVVLDAPSGGYANPGAVLVPVAVRASDETGVAEAWAVYTLQAGGEAHVDSVRLSMSESDLSLFSGTIAPGELLTPGDEILYRVRLQDADGNSATYPAPSALPLTWKVRLHEERAISEGTSINGDWLANGPSGFRLNHRLVPADRSALVLPPVDLPRNADSLALVLDHQYALGTGASGNVMLSLDHGRTWLPLRPLRSTDGETALVGTWSLPDRFRLTDYAGRQVQIRIDFATDHPLEKDEFWQIGTVRLFAATGEPDFETTRELALHPAFPNPFASSTTVSYTLEESADVQLVLYDVLGRQMALVDKGSRPAGTYTVEVDGTRLASGVYWLRLEAGHDRRVRTLVVAH